jgi:hypothetical protein
MARLPTGKQWKDRYARSITLLKEVRIIETGFILTT